jgi:hypothetical protein
MMLEKKTTINELKLDEWCETLPQCSTFLENFFISCRPYDYLTNLMNYAREIERSVEPNLRQYENQLLMAFLEIVYDKKEMN